MTLGKRIQTLRKAAGLSQDALGERLGVTRQAVSRWEADGTVPEVDNLIAMARVFGVTVDELLCGAPEPEEEPAPVEPAAGEEEPAEPPATPELWAKRPAPICQSYEGGGTKDITNWRPLNPALFRGKEELDGKTAYLLEGAFTWNYPLDLKNDSYPVAVPRSGEFQILVDDEVAESIPVELAVTQDEDGVWRTIGSADIHSRVELPDPGKRYLEKRILIRFVCTDQFDTVYQCAMWKSEACLSGNTMRNTRLWRNVTYISEME